MSGQVDTALTWSRRTVRLAAAVQAVALLSAILVFFHLATGLFIPLLAWDLPDQSSSRLVLLWTGLGNYDQLHAKPSHIWLLAALGALPYLLVLLAVAQLWRFFGCARRNSLPTTRSTKFLREFGVLIALAALAAATLMPIAWSVVTNGSGEAAGTAPWRITADQLLLLLFSVVPIAMSSIMRDAAIASEEARSIV